MDYSCRAKKKNKRRKNGKRLSCNWTASEATENGKLENPEDTKLERLREIVREEKKTEETSNLNLVIF